MACKCNCKGEGTVYINGLRAEDYWRLEKESELNQSLLKYLNSITNNLLTLSAHIETLGATIERLNSRLTFQPTNYSGGGRGGQA